MKFRSVVPAIIFTALTSQAFGQTKPTAPVVITVADAISIWNAINALDSHQTGVVDKNGNAVVAPNNFEYSGAVHLVLARNAAKAYLVLKEYNDELAKLRARFDDDKAGVPKEQLADFTAEKQNAYEKRSAEMLAAPAGVEFLRVKEADLCLDAKPPSCPVKNAIPISVLTALLPILD